MSGNDTLLFAAQDVINHHNRLRGLEEGLPPSVDLYHLLDSLLEWSDRNGVDFDATLSELRADLIGDRTQ